MNAQEFEKGLAALTNDLIHGSGCNLENHVHFLYEAKMAGFLTAEQSEYYWELSGNWHASRVEKRFLRGEITPGQCLRELASWIGHGANALRLTAAKQLGWLK